MQPYELQSDTFIIRDYDLKPPFSSFLPGLAGITGIPMWLFYTNRGQAVASFGIHHKGNAMMEFSPANTEYENTQIRGFRTFMRVDGRYYEPFFRPDDTAHRVMKIERNALSVSEERDGLRISVTYFILPNDDIGAVVRTVTVENTGDKKVSLEILDGMPQVIPYGIQLSQYKEISNLLKSWSDIINAENDAPIFKMRAAGDDTAEMKEITGGWFYACACDGRLMPIVYDKAAVFDLDQTMLDPVRFRRGGLKAVSEKEQAFVNKVPCAFAALSRELEKGGSLKFTACMGYTATKDILNRKTREMLADGYAESKLAQARAEADRLTEDVKTSTADRAFDAYIRQCYMDNFLRGGYPFMLGEGENKKTVHLFSRKHGDPERDYNFFSIAGEYFSQGNGNFRDVCQNRRMDCSIHPEVGAYNVRNFYSLIQMDGCNPLEIRPCTFRLIPGREDEARSILEKHLDAGADTLLRLLGEKFTPGQITSAIVRDDLTLKGDPTVFVGQILSLCDQFYEAGFAEGYWSDHWDYTLDLAEDYLSVWPEKKDELLFGSADCLYYDSPAAIRPRRLTYVIQNGHVRQYGAVFKSEKKLSLPGFDPAGTNWLREAGGRAAMSTLYEKMLTLAVNKFALLDSQRLGIEMDGGKPGWNDAMNGLPGILGSGMPETLELRRLVRFLKDVTGRKDPESKIPLYEEPALFMRALFDAYEQIPDMYRCWDRAATLREEFRERIEAGISGRRTNVTFGELNRILTLFGDVLEDSVKRALEIGNGIMPTFFTYEADDFEPRLNDDGTPFITPYGMPGAIVRSLRRVDLPFFLEGPARYLASCDAGDRASAETMARKILSSGLYDTKLKMYKTSESIERCGMEIGRVRVFTPGWLERESVFLHMEYKYLLGLIRAGLYDAFYTAADAALICRLDPAVYGRSILENSSFIASSVNPDPDTHGRGYVGRLSGSTAEMLSIWKMMFVGTGGFHTGKDGIRYRFAPILRRDMFDENGEAAFTLCGTCRVTYHNTTGRDTYGAGCAAVRSITAFDGVDRITFDGDSLPEAQSDLIRRHKMVSIDVRLE